MNQKNKNGVYVILNTINGKMYVGSSAGKRGFSDRWSTHRFELRNNKHHSPKLQNAWNKYGESNFYFCILEICAPVDAVSVEQYYIDLFKPYTNIGYNILSIAGSSLGHKHSQATRDKIRRNQLGELNNRFGTKHTPETINQMRLAQTGSNNYMFGLHRSLKIRQKISKTLTGISRSNATKKKMSEAKKGSKNPGYGKKQSAATIQKRANSLCKLVIRSDGKTYKSLKEAAKDMRTSPPTISFAVRFNIKRVGYGWKYLIQQSGTSDVIKKESEVVEEDGSNI